MYQSKALIISFLFAICFPVTAQENADAEDDSQQAMAEMKTPSRGMTMEAVKALIGNAENVRDPVGEPPITRWVYESYTVYFEHDRVITTVSNDIQ